MLSVHLGEDDATLIGHARGINPAFPEEEKQQQSTLNFQTLSVINSDQLRQSIFDRPRIVAHRRHGVARGV